MSKLKVLSVLMMFGVVAGSLGVTFKARAALEAYAMRIATRNSDNDGDVISFISQPASGVTELLGWTGASPSTPKSIGVGSGLQFTGSTLGIGTIAIANGGTGATSASAAITALLPSQVSNSGKVLTTDGSSATWQTPSTPTARTQSSASRSLNTCFLASSTRDILANYSVEIAASLSLTGGTVGNAFLEIYNDSGCTTGTQEISRVTNGNTGTLTIGLNTVQTSTGNLTGYVPAGKYVQIRTTSTTGTATFAYRSGQETLL
jgi:hypothetical protein